MPISNPILVKSNGLQNTPNVACLGWYGKDNCGDEAYKIAIPKLFPNLNFVSFADTLPPSYDIVIVGGGDILSNKFLSQLIGINKPVYAISVTASKSLTSYNIPFKKILVRDFASLKNIRQEGLSAEYCPDLTFGLSPNVSNGQDLIQHCFKDRDLYKNVVGVTINANLMADPERSKSFIEGISFSKFSYDICQLIDSTSASFIFIPFGMQQPWDDRAANGFVASRSKFWQKTAVIYNKLSVQETLDIISACDAMISTRLHSSIFSCIAETPFIDIVHNHKNEWFLNTINHLDYATTFRNFDYLKACNLLNDILSNRTSHLLQLKMINREQKQILQQQVERCTYAMMTSEL